MPEMQRPGAAMCTHYQTVVSELMNAYQENRNLTQFQNLISAHQYLHLCNTLARYVGDGETVLDWGTGNGHFSYFLARSGHVTSGYGFGEIPEVCRGLQDEHYTYRRGDIADPVKIPYGDQSFDAVVSVGVLEHVRDSGGDEIESLKEICRLLKPGGVLLSSTQSTQLD